MPLPRHRVVTDCFREHQDRLAYVEAVIDEDDKRRVAVPPSSVRKRWARMQRTLSAMTWIRIDLYNSKNEMLASHQRTAEDDAGPAGEVEDLGTPTPFGRGAQELQVACHWIVRAQDMALSRHTAAMQPLLDAQNKMIDSTIRRFEVMDKQYAELMRLNHALNGNVIQNQLEQLRKIFRDNASGSDGSESGAMLDQLLPALVGAALQPKEGATNGATNGTPRARTRDHDGERRDRDARRNGTSNKE